MQLNDLTTCGGLFTDETGKPLAGGLLACYLPGSSIFKALYAEDGTLVSNPAGIGSDGYLETPAYLGEGVSELKLYAPNFPGAVYDPNDFPGTDWRLVRSWRVRGSGGAQALPSVTSIADLRHLDCTQMAAGAVVAVSGYYAQGDSPSRLFTLKDGSATDNGGTLIAALGGGRYWEWEPEGDIDVRTFGAIPGGDRDNRPMIAAAANLTISSYRGLSFPAGVYKVSAGEVSVRGVFMAAGVSFLNDTANTLFKLRILEWNNIRLDTSARDISSAGKVLLDFSGYYGSDPVNATWNFDWGEEDGGADLVNWAPNPSYSRAPFRVFGGNIAIAQDLGRVEIAALHPYIKAATGYTPSIAEVVSTGGSAYFTSGAFTFGKCYASAASFNGATFSGNYILDEDVAIDYRFNGATIVGAGGLAALNLTGADISLAGVESDGPIFGTITGGTTPPNIVRAPVGTLKAFHFSDISTINAFASLYENSTNGEVDLGGRSTFAELKGVFVQNSATIRNGTVQILASASFNYPIAFEDCHLVVTNGAAFNVSLSLSRCEVNGPVNVPTGAAITALDCTFKNRIALTGDMGDTLLLRNSFTGAGSALDASGVTSWTGKCRIAENMPVSFNKSPSTPYWPQTEGELRSGGSGAWVEYTDASKGGDTSPLVAADSLRVGFASCTATACYAVGITNGLRANTYDGNAAGSGAIWSIRFNFTKLS